MVLPPSQLPGEGRTPSGEVLDPLADLGDGLAGLEVQLANVGAGDRLGLGGPQRLETLGGMAAAQFGVGRDSVAGGLGPDRLGGVVSAMQFHVGANGAGALLPTKPVQRVVRHQVERADRPRESVPGGVLADAFGPGVRHGGELGDCQQSGEAPARRLRVHLPPDGGSGPRKHERSLGDMSISTASRMLTRRWALQHADHGSDLPAGATASASSQQRTIPGELR